MYNRYLEDERSAFDELYRAVDDSPREEIKKTEVKASHSEKFDLRRLFNGLNINEMGIIPIVLLLLILIDVDDEERIIIIAMAFIFGI